MVSFRGPQRNRGSDCLLKTQGYANSQEEVYGLTPARCWKVKGRGHWGNLRSFEPKPQ